jgi:hypothetical protein
LAIQPEAEITASRTNMNTTAQPEIETACHCGKLKVVPLAIANFPPTKSIACHRDRGN